jgi:hypothetical protein
MFDYASAFNQDLCDWNVDSVTDVLNFCSHGASCGGCSWYESSSVPNPTPTPTPGIFRVMAVPSYVVLRSTEAPTKSPRRRSPRSF